MKPRRPLTGTRPIGKGRGRGSRTVRTMRLTRAEQLWVAHSPQPLARQFRLWCEILTAWPTPYPPLAILAMVIDELRQAAA